MKYRFLIILFLLSGLSLPAQIPRFYNSSSDLPGMSICRIYQDKDGYVWVSTQDGVSRFDSGEQEIWWMDSVLDIFEDSRGTLWLCTAEGLKHYDRETREFLIYDLHDPEIPGSSLYFTSIVETPGGHLVATTSSRGVYVINIRDYLPDLPARDAVNRMLSAQYINEALCDSRGWLWLAYEEGGIVVIDMSLPVPEPEPASSASLPSSILVSNFAEDPLDKSVVIATYNSGLYRYNRYSGNAVLMKGTEDLSVRDIVFNTLQQPDGRHTFVIGTEGKGIHLFDVETGRMCDNQLPGASRFLDSGSVHSLLFDRQGNLWTGVYQRGVYVYPRKVYDFTLLNPTENNPYAFPASSVKSVYRDEATSDLWVGTDGGGVFVLGKNGKVRNFNTSNSSLKSDAVMAICADDSGSIWLGTYLGGLFYYRPETGLHPFPGNGELPNLKIKSLVWNSSDSKLYVGSSGGGIYVITPESFQLEAIICEDDYKWVSDLESCIDGNVWVGTYNGLRVLDPVSGTVSAVNIGDSSEKYRIYDLKEDENGNLWCGTGAGLFRLSRADGVISRFDVSDSGSPDYVKSVLPSSQGIWVATGSCLCNIEEETHKVKSYYYGDGIGNSEFYTGSCFIDSEGLMYFGGNSGVTCFNPSRVDIGRRKIGELSFSKLTVLDKVSSINGKDMLEIPFKSNMFSVRFSVPEYTNPDRVVYSYMLEGFDGDWHNAAHGTRSATYTNIPHGKYMLKARAYFIGTPDEFSENSIQINVGKPWYLKWWALLLYLLFASMSALLVYLVYRSTLKEKKERLAAAKKELRLATFTDMTHEIRTPLSLVMSPLKRLREREQDASLKDTYNLMYRNCLRINRTVNQLLDLRKVDEGQLKLHFVKTDIVSFIEDIMNTFRGLAESENIMFTMLKQDNPIYLWIDPGNFDKIIFNLFSNAFKNTPENGRIEVIIRQESKDSVNVSIFNSGSHIDERYVERIFERFFQIDSGLPVNGSGVGLNLAKKLVELHHGEISALNVEGGVVFSVVLPSGCAHLSEEELSPTNHHKGLYHLEPVDDETSSRKLIAQQPVRKPLKTMKSLVVVEDDADALSFLCKDLSDRYFSVKGFLSADEAWIDICRTVPDAVVTDLVMPGMSGLSLCQKIRHNPQTNHIPVIVLTSQSDEETQKQCSEAGVDRYFVKPAPLEVFASVIDQTIISRNMLKGKYTNKVDYEYEKVKMPFDDSNFYEKVVACIKKHLDDSDFTVEELSGELGMSRVHLNRKMKEIGSVSPGILIRSIRLKQAAYLLVSSKVNVSEVAYRVGFASHSYFTRTFRSYFGMSPTEFLEKYADRADSEEFRKIIE